MNNKIKQEIDKIHIPLELNERSKTGIMKAKAEKDKNKKKINIKLISLAASLVILIGAFALYDNIDRENNHPGQDSIIINEDGSIQIPVIQLPEDGTVADMIGLIVYNKKIYTQTMTEIAPEDAKKLLGEKLGTTKGNIDEWSKQDEYDKEFASTIGKTGVYSVIGYDKEFRIMAYQEAEGKAYAGFYEALNGITVHDGEDIFGNLKITGNVENAEYRFFDDWDSSIKKYHTVRDMAALNSFIEYLNQAEPFLRDINSDPIRESRNNEQFRELTIRLRDGSRVNMNLIKGGYVYYGYMNIYFKMDEDVFTEFWNQLN